MTAKTTTSQSRMQRLVVNLYFLWWLSYHMGDLLQLRHKSPPRSAQRKRTTTQTLTWQVGVVALYLMTHRQSYLCIHFSRKHGEI